MSIAPSRSVTRQRLLERKSIIVDGDTRNRFEVTFEAGEPIEIKIERWAECTTGKRFWARCWMAERPLGGQNRLIVERARTLLSQTRALSLVVAAGFAADFAL